jgi:hypothetical protein
MTTAPLIKDAATRVLENARFWISKSKELDSSERREVLKSLAHFVTERLEDLSLAQGNTRIK